MKDKQKQKGLILLMVMGLALIISIGIVALLFVLEANRSNLESIRERTQAYYLCELGASAAILDIAHGCVGDSSEVAPADCPSANSGRKWKERTFTYRMGNRDYPIQYTVRKIHEHRGPGDWQIISQVGVSAGFNRTYNLKIEGRRAFPIFIRGFSGK